jgi:hypothetical protein
MTYIIEPFKSINNLHLASTIAEVELLLGKFPLEHNPYTSDYFTGIYKDGITISYKEGLVCYIGVHTSLGPIVHSSFDFSNKSFLEIIAYFKKYSGDIFIEDEIAIVSEYLGISTYFEDGLKEVAIFSKSYSIDIIKGLEKINLNDNIFKKV